MGFTVSALVFGVILVLAATVAARAASTPDLWRWLPRDRRVGLLLGGICLGWAALLAYPLLEGGLAGLRRLLLPLVIVLAVLCYFLLDYLFTRALGGMLLLSVNLLLHEAFVWHAPLRPVFAVVCYAYGIAGMVMIASPYRFRDLLEKISQQAQWRRALVAGLLASGGFSVALSLAGHAA